MAHEITAADLLRYLGLETPEAGSSDEFVVDLVVKGVNRLVPQTVPRVRQIEADAAAAGTDPVWPDDVMEGAIMQAARLFHRRRSPGSVASYADTTGAATMISRWDPDIERLMNTGKWAPPMFG